MGIANFGPLDALTQGVDLEFHDITRLGPDLRIIARVQGRDQF